MHWHNEAELTCNNDNDFLKFEIHNEITEMIVDQNGYVHLKGKPIDKTQQLGKSTKSIWCFYFSL